VNADILSLIVINAVSGALLGLAVTVAVDVLPGSKARRVATHWAIVAAWAVALTAVTVAGVDPGQGRILRRWLNVVVIAYVGSLLVLHARRAPWHRKAKS